MKPKFDLLHSFGFTDDEESLKIAQSNIALSYKVWMEVCAYSSNHRLPPLGIQGTLIHQLSVGFTSEDSHPLSHLGSSAECCVSNLMFLDGLISDYKENGTHYSTWAIGSVSRSVLISAARILYVLLPDSLETKQENFEKIHFSNLRSRQKYQKVADDFTYSNPYNPHFGIVDIPKGSGISDTDMTDEAIKYVNKNIYSGSVESSGAVVERISMMWNIWSGLTHGMEWPTMLPNKLDERSSSIMPGNYMVDFALLSALVLTAIQQLRDAFLEQIV